MLARLQSLLAIVALTFAFNATAAEYSAGNGYTLLNQPVAVVADGKIHVEEAFWYGCPHCYELEGSVSQWSKTLAKDVELSGVPAQFGRPWVSHAQLYYTADILGILEKVHAPIFNAIHRGNQRLVTKSDQRDFLMEAAGITAEEFDKAYDSFTVRSRMKQANQRIQAFGINGVPAMIVQGKYVVDASSANGQRNILKVVDFLIEKERQALKN